MDFGWSRDRASCLFDLSFIHKVLDGMAESLDVGIGECIFLFDGIVELDEWHDIIKIKYEKKKHAEKLSYNNALTSSAG